MPGYADVGQTCHGASRAQAIDGRGGNGDGVAAVCGANSRRGDRRRSERHGVRGTAGELMGANDWRGIINGLLYGLIFVPEITDEVVEFYADAAVNYTVLGDGPEAYCRAIDEALASGERLDGLSQLPQFPQAQIAAYLRALVARLQDLRPWPEPKF